MNTGPNVAEDIYISTVSMSKMTFRSYTKNWHLIYLFYWHLTLAHPLPVGMLVPLPNIVNTLCDVFISDCFDNNPIAVKWHMLK